MLQKITTIYEGDTMKISKTRFDAFIKMRDSGKMNMFGFHDREIIPNFDGLVEHFAVQLETEDYEVPK